MQRHPHLAERWSEPLEAITGDKFDGCPWRAMSDPYVIDILTLHNLHERGVLALACPKPSHRQIEGLVHLKRVLERIDAANHDREERERKRQNPNGA